MQPIFISYRRSDADGQALNLSRDLKAKFGQAAVLIDVDGLEKGRDFRKTIDDRLATCKVLLALIGRSWLDAKDEHGARRLDNHADFVRYEIAKALHRDIPVIPVLVGGASMPEASELPSDLQDLVFRDGIELTHARWDSDVQVLIKFLEPYVPPLPPPPRETPQHEGATHGMSSARKGLIAVVGAAVVACAGWYVYDTRTDEQARASELAAQREEASRLAAELAAREKAAQQAAADKMVADKAAADTAVADRLTADKVAADKAIADKAAKKLAAGKAAADQAAAGQLAIDQAAALAQRQAAEAAARRVQAADSIAAVALVSYGPAGAKFDVRYETRDRSPTTTTGIKVCIIQAGRLVPGTSCMTHWALPGPSRALIEMAFRDSTATALKGRNQATVNSCLGTFPRGNPREFLSMTATCRMQAW